MDLPTLQEFPQVPVPSQITIGEYGAQFVAKPGRSIENPPDGRLLTDKIQYYHRISGNDVTQVLPYKIPSIKTRSFRKESLLIRRDEGLVKGIWDSYMDSGWKGVQSFLGQVEKPSSITVLYTCLTVLRTVCDTTDSLKSRLATLFFPHLAMESTDVIEQYCRTRNWKKCWARAMAWHPQFPKLALALRDDSIRICTVGEEVLPMLRSADQKNVNCISWRPHIQVELAVGVDEGIVLWQMNSPTAIKPGACKTRFLTQPGHFPVTSVEYSSTGLLLLSSSPQDTSMYIWDVGTWKSTALKRIGGGGVSISCWSPFEDRILNTSPSSVFRVWEKHEKWTPRRWTTPRDPIEAACWTPDSSTLLFASGGIIYALQFMLSDIHKFIHQEDCLVLPLYDIKECHVDSEDGQLQYKIGGKVRRMDMDPAGNRLAILFDDSELIAVFRVQSKSSSFLAPCGFIRGFPDEYPAVMEFQKDFKDGALLTIAWNSGRLQYFPFLFGAPGLNNKNILHDDYYKSPTRLYSGERPVRRSLGVTQEDFGPAGNDGGSVNKSYKSRQSLPVFKPSSFTNPPAPSAPSFDDIENSADEEDMSDLCSEEMQARSPRLFSLK